MALLQTGRAMFRGLSGNVAAVQCRMNSSNVSVDVNAKTGVATLSMNRKPVNSLNLELLTDFSNALDQIEQDKAKGVILTSSLPKVFSAGIDITEMYKPQTDRLGEFWRSLQTAWMKLYGFRLPVIAAINGNSPAGGCLLAMSCDYRIMADNNYSIGLNETKLGIVAPKWFEDTMVNTIGHRQTEKALQLGLLYSGPEALQVGLVDRLVPQDALMQAAEEEMKTWQSIHSIARMLTKNQMRQATIDKLANNRDKDVEYFVKFVTQEPMQKAMGMYMEMLKAKSAKKAAS